MNLGISERVQPLLEQVRQMMQDEIIQADIEFHAEVGKQGNRWALTTRQTEILESLQTKAREQGLWNFWLTDSERGLSLIHI